jgi:PAS domain S-box-containing protein
MSETRTRHLEPDIDGVSQARLAAIVEFSDDAIISKTLDGVITSWNQAAERLFGYTRAEAVGQHITLIIPSERRNEEVEILAKLRKGESISHFETQRLGKDGKLVEISLSVSPLWNVKGELVGASKIARDITDRKKLEMQSNQLLEKERALREDAQRINILKDEFLATLSHELRNPLNAILGWSQLLIRGNMNSDGVKQAAEVISRGAKMQKQLIDDLLDMSRIIAGKLRVEISKIDPALCIGAAVETVKASAEAKNIAINIDFGSKLDWIFADSERLQQVVCNLLTNAVKFTPRGGKIDVATKKIDSHVEISVSDSGEGIDPEFLPFIFERFRQADSSASRVHGGLGLGLSISKQLISLHGGSISAESDGKGRGAKFTVSLPLNEHVTKTSEGPAKVLVLEEQLPLNYEEIDLSGVKILVVEDEPGSRDLIKTVLENCNAEIVIAESGTVALELLNNFVPAIIISDIGMPGMDGYDFLKEVKKMKNGAERVPAIALTAFVRESDRARALKSGFDEHIAKPADPSKLVEVVSRLIKKN